MKSSVPKRQHYIPKMLLKRFLDDDGFIWVHDGEKMYKANLGNVFSIGHLYTRSEFGNAPKGSSYNDFLNSIQKSFEYEGRLSEIETEAEPVVQRIIDRARNGRCPQLSVDFREAWKRFYVAMARRTPEAQDRVSKSKGNRDVFYEAAKQTADQIGYRLPTAEKLYQDPRVMVLKKLVMSNTNAKFAAGDDPNIETETRRFSVETGLCVVAIGIPKRSFVIGSHGLTMLDDEVASKMGAVSWLPIAHDVAVGATAFPDREFLTILDSSNDGQQLISSFNRATADRSKIVAGRCQALVRCLVQG